MQYIAFILNLPWSILSLFGALLSLPKSAKFSKKHTAIIFTVTSFWWNNWIPGKARVRAQVGGHIVRIGPKADARDLEHEMIHVEQHIRRPFIHPILYLIETLKNGYRHNKYEEEAYSRSGSQYKP